MQGDIIFSKDLNRRYFRNKKNGFFIECGAEFGTERSVCKWYEDTLGWTGINMEPHPELFARLAKNRPNSINLNYALASTAGKDTLFSPYRLDRPDKVEISGWATVDSGRKKDLAEHGGVEFDIEKITYQQLLKDNNIQKIDLFILDVEGFELDIVGSFRETDVFADVMAIETNKTDKHQLLNILKKFGYRLDFSDRINSYFVRR